MDGCPTQRTVAGIFTKAFISKETWSHAVRLLGFRDKPFDENVARTSRLPRMFPCSVASLGLLEVVD